MTKTKICAGSTGKSTCHGDSGDGLICIEDGKAVLAGVVSYANWCAKKDNPTVYAKTSVALRWINNEMVII